jgi:phosphinothricin acetyltransferase
MEIVLCDRTFVPAIRTILNDAIVNTTAVWDYRPRSAATMDEWFEQKLRQGWPVIGVVEGMALLGFATYGPFRAWPAYKYTVEHSLYVDSRFRRHGIGRRLLDEIVRDAQARDYHAVIGAIAADNDASLRLHEQAGFVPCGTIREAGYKFGRWLDLMFVQRVLSSPAAPHGD